MQGGFIINDLIEKEDIKIENMIYELRGKQVMLDSDLAKLYRVETKRINEAVKNNMEKFPERFSWKLTEEESKMFLVEIFDQKNIETRGGRYRCPRVFTEQGVAMLATILKSKVATQVSIRIMDAFVAMRKYISNDLMDYGKMLINHENRLSLIENTFDSFKDKNNHIFFEGQIYDAYSLMLNIFDKSKESIIIIDNYICAYCDFCKVFYNKKLVNSYLDALEKEIKNSYRGEIITSLYIGGGTPSSLCAEELTKLFNILKIFNLSSSAEITMEANSDSLNIDKIKKFKDFGINRVSIGVETINDKLQKVLERNTNKDKTIKCVNNLKKVGINNINVDLIYAIEGETIEDLKNDLKFILSLDVPHISTYSLIIEDNTKLKINGVKNIDKVLDRNMYDIISKTLKDKGYVHYEISNFSKPLYESVHNLKYWHNNHYYGFGVGSSGYLYDVRYTNTRSITKYIEGKTVLDKEVLSIKDKMFYEIMLNLRTNEGIDKRLFKIKYNTNIEELIDYKNLVKKGIIEDADNHLRVKEQYFYVLDEVLLQLIDL